MALASKLIILAQDPRTKCLLNIMFDCFNPYIVQKIKTNLKYNFDC